MQTGATRIPVMRLFHIKTEFSVLALFTGFHDDVNRLIRKGPKYRIKFFTGAQGEQLFLFRCFSG